MSAGRTWWALAAACGLLLAMAGPVSGDSDRNVAAGANEGGRGAHPLLSTIDSSGRVGAFASIAIGADGRGLISHFDFFSRNLKVTHCDNVPCTSATTSTIDDNWNAGYEASIAIGADGRGLISYQDRSNRTLNVAHCEDIRCTRATTSAIDDDRGIGPHTSTSIAIGADGRGLISYQDRPNRYLKVGHCDNVPCTSATTSTIDDKEDVGWHSSIAIGADGRGLISYHDEGNANLKVAHCDNLPCTSATTSTIDSGGANGYVGSFTSIAIGADGRGLISYQDRSWPFRTALKVAHCEDTRCTRATTSTIDDEDVGGSSSIAIGADGRGLISYDDNANANLKVAHCDNVPCTSATTSTIDSGGANGYVGSFTSIAIGADGRGLISYHDAARMNLKAAHCANVRCTNALPVAVAIQRAIRAGRLLSITAMLDRRLVGRRVQVLVGDGRRILGLVSRRVGSDRQVSARGLVSGRAARARSLLVAVRTPRTAAMLPETQIARSARRNPRLRIRGGGRTATRLTLAGRVSAALRGRVVLTARYLDERGRPRRSRARAARSGARWRATVALPAAAQHTVVTVATRGDRRHHGQGQAARLGS